MFFIAAVHAGAMEGAELSEILEIAARSNPDIYAASERIRRAREDVNAASAAMGPSLTAGASARRNARESFGRDREQTNAYLNLSRALYAGGSLTANRHAAEMALAAERASGVRTYQETLHNVRASYYDCLRALAQTRVAAEAKELAGEHLKQAEALFAAGMAPRGDVLRVKVSVNQSELDMISARSSLDVSWTALERAAGAKPDRESVLKVVSGMAIDGLSPPDYDVPEDFVRLAVSGRAEVEAYKRHIERAEALILSAKGRRLPRLSVSGQLNSDGDASSSVNDEWYVGLEMQWTLYDSGEISAAVRGAQSAKRELQERLKSVTAQVTQEALAAEIRLRAAIERRDLAREQMNTSLEDYAIALRRYDAQMGTNLDVLDARRALTTSRMEYVNAVYDIAHAQAGLIYAIGEDTPPKGVLE